MGTLGTERLSGDWTSRIIKLESEVNNWRIKFEIQSLWRKVVEDWIFDEFGFDVTRHAQRLESDFRKANVIDVTFSTKNVEVDFNKLKLKLIKQADVAKGSASASNNNSKDPNQVATSPRKALKNLPASITVTEINPIQLSPGSYERLVGVSIESVDDVEHKITNVQGNVSVPATEPEPDADLTNVREQEQAEEVVQIQSVREPSYEFSSIPEDEGDSANDDITEVDVDAADRTEYPLTIYDLEEDEDEAIASADQADDAAANNISKIDPTTVSSLDDSISYQTDDHGIEFTTIEATSDMNDEDQGQEQDFEDNDNRECESNDHDLELNIEEADEDEMDPDEIDPGTLVAVTHDVDVNETRKRTYRSRPARSLIQTIVVPGEKKKFQCLACRRIFSDRGNGHRHVRRMHPGQSVNAQKRAEFQMASVDRDGDCDPPIPILIPEVSLGDSPPTQSPSQNQSRSTFSDASFPDLTCMGSQGEEEESSRLDLSNVHVPSGIDIEAVEDFNAEEYEELPVEENDDEDDDNEFEDEEESFLCRDNSNMQETVPISVLVPGQFEEQDQMKVQVQGKLTMEQRREAAKLIRKVSNNQFKCIQCNRLFSVSCNARRHARVVHFGERLYECRICHKRFSSKTDGVIHEKFCYDKQGGHLNLNLEAVPVAAATSSLSLSPVRVRPRPRRRPSNANVGDKNHLPIRRLRRTYGKNGRIVNVPANVLSTGLISKKVNGSTTFYECKVCQNRYADIRSAWSHAKRMHLTEKPHKCTNCPKSYFNRKDFLKHQLKCGPMELNDGEKDYEDSMELNSHMVEMMEVDPRSMSGSETYHDHDDDEDHDPDQDSSHLGHFLEISEVNDDGDGDDDEVANAS